MSRVIKSTFASTVEHEKRLISHKKMSVPIENQVGSVSLIAEKEERSQLVDAVIEEAKKEADQIKKQAQMEYEQFQNDMNEQLITMQKQAEDMFVQAEQNGYNEGFQKGIEQGQRQYESFIQEARSIVEASKEDYFRKLEESESVMVELSVAIAKKILGQSISEDETNWISLVRNALNEAKEQQEVKIYVHPDSYHLTLSQKEELKLFLPDCENLFIYPDAHVNENSCVIETPFGRIDASVDSQLAEIKLALLEKLKEGALNNESC